MAAELKLLIDQAGKLWEKGKLVNKVRPLSPRPRRARRPESTILALDNTLYHWGAIVPLLGYTVSEAFNGGGNPYGASFVTEGGIHGGPDERALTVARAQGQRLTRITGVIARAREQGLLEDRAGVIRDPLRATASG